MKSLYPIRPILPADDVRFRRGEVTAELLLSGDTLLIYANHSRATIARDGCVLSGDNAKASIYSQRLNLNGEPVGEEKLLFACPETLLNIMSPALRRLPDGSLGMAFSWRESKTSAKRVFVKSADEGETWSEPVTIAEGGYVTGCHDRLLVLKSGRILAPLHASDDWDKHYLHVFAAYSDDCGESWSRSNLLELPAVYWPDGRAFTESGCIEPGACELPDGRVMMVLRTGMGSVFYSISTDGGARFSKPMNLEVAGACAPAHISSLPGGAGALLVWSDIYCADQALGGGRHRFVACASASGVDFPRSRRILLIEDDEHVIDYPIVQYRADEIWLFFRVQENREKGGAISSYMMKFPLSILELC